VSRCAADDSISSGLQLPRRACAAERFDAWRIVDRHADLNVPGSTADGALDWMGVAHMLDIDGAVDALAALAGHRPMLSSEEISFLGLGRTRTLRPK
jgi:arginase